MKASEKSNPYTPPRLRDMAKAERPQERLEARGAAVLSDTELLAMLLRSGSKDLDVLALSSRLISDAGSLYGLLSWSVHDFLKFKGIGKVKALQLLTVMEVARRILNQRGGQNQLFETSEQAFGYFRPIAAGLDVEKFWVLCLNRKNRLIRQVEVTSGTASNSLVHPREVFREAIRNGSSAIICAHNHPSGDPSPSRADIAVTRQLRSAAKTVDIDLLDHVIIGDPSADPSGIGFYSFSDAGLI